MYIYLFHPRYFHNDIFNHEISQIPHGVTATFTLVGAYPARLEQLL